MMHYGWGMPHWSWFTGRFNFFGALTNILIVFLVIAAIRWLWIKGDQEKNVKGSR